MRLTGGALKGRRVCTQGLGGKSMHGVLRATSSKVREALFNILAAKVEGSVFVDLYAGSGAVGMEAMSRGAASVYFVEADGKRAESLLSLMEGCGCRERARMVRMNATEFITKSASEGRKWDIVFLDPPYRSDELEKVLPLIGEGTVLAPGAVVIAEHMKKHGPPERAGVLGKTKTYKYGDTVLTLYEGAL